MISEGKVPVFAADELQMKSKGKVPVLAAGSRAAARELLSPRTIPPCAPCRIEAQREYALAVSAALQRALIRQAKRSLVITRLTAPIAAVN